MATVLEPITTNVDDPVSDPTASETPTTENVPNEEHERQMIEAAFQRIRSVREYLAGSVIQQIGCYCRIGLELVDLKSKIQHGEWKDRVKEEFGYGTETVSRLRAIAEADMATHIVTLRQDLLVRLSGDLQKLAKLAQLPCRLWPEALKQVDLATASRTEVRKAIDELREKHGLINSDSQNTKRTKRAVSVRQIKATCDKLTTFAKSLAKDLQAKTTDAETRTKAKKAVQNAVATLQKLLDVCEQTAS